MLLPGKICRHANRDVIYMFHINIAIIHLLTNPVAFILKYQTMNIKKKYYTVHIFELLPYFCVHTGEIKHVFIIIESLSLYSLAVRNIIKWTITLPSISSYNHNTTIGYMQTSQSMHMYVEG